MRIREANLLATRKKTEREAELSAEKERERQNNKLYEASLKSLESIMTKFKKKISEETTESEIINSAEFFHVKLNGADLYAGRPKICQYIEWGRYPPTFEVIAYSSITLTLPESDEPKGPLSPWDDNVSYTGRSSSLWFCDAQETGKFRWYEISFVDDPTRISQREETPFVIDPGENVHTAFHPVSGLIVLNAPVIPIDHGDENDFIDRWMVLLADAAEGKLERPRVSPENSNTRGSYRIK